MRIVFINKAQRIRHFVFQRRSFKNPGPLMVKSLEGSSGRPESVAVRPMALAWGCLVLCVGLVLGVQAVVFSPPALAQDSNQKGQIAKKATDRQSSSKATTPKRTKKKPDGKTPKSEVVAKPIDESLEYYLSIALKCPVIYCEPQVKKFPGPVSLGVFGVPTSSDWAGIQRTVQDWNALCPTYPITLNTTPSSWGSFAINLVYLPTANLATWPQYVPGNPGWFSWTGSLAALDRLTTAFIGVGSDQPETARLFMTRMFLTNVMGLPNQIPKYPDSVFNYENWSRVTSYSQLDTSLIKKHCDPRVTPGMREPEIRNIFATG